MKRTELKPDQPQETQSIKIPTIDQLLYSMPKTGLESFEDRLLAYSTLGYHFNGIDYSNATTRTISKLIKLMDEATEIADTKVLEDEDSDRYGFDYEGVEYWFYSPSIKQLPKTPKDNIPKYYRELIEGLAEKPGLIFELPYNLFSAVGDALGKCLGIV